MKGFRKGTTPLGLFKKIYGNHVLSETIKDLTDKEVADYLRQNNLHYFANPLLVNEDTQGINYTDPEKVYTLNLELGLKPQIDFSVLYSPEHEFVKYVPYTTDAEIDEQIDLMRKEYGTVSDLTETDAIQLNDIVYVRSEETDADGNVKEGGISHTTPIVPDLLKPGTEKDALLNLKLNESTVQNLFNLFDKSREEVAWQMLNVTENIADLPDNYKITITQIRRRIPADLDETFFGQIFPDTEITTLEAFKEKLTEVMNGNLAQEGASFLQKQLKKILPKAMALQLPELFVRKFINERSNQAYADDEKWNASKNYFLEEFTWQLIREELVKQFDIKVQEDEINQAIIYNVYSEIKRTYNIDLPYDMLLKYAKKDLDNEEQRTLVYQRLQDYYGINALLPNLHIKEEPVTSDEFRKIREEFSDADNEDASDLES